jgi:uncharacterized protein (UPF0261 family)
MRPTILVIGTCDTKGRELGFLVESLDALGGDAHLLDVGIIGEPQLRPETSASEVAGAAGTTLEQLREVGRGEALTAIAEGARLIAERLVAGGAIHGVIAAGGGGNTTVASAVMRALPVGLPKVMLSTVASGNTAPFVGGADIVMMHSVVDVASLNSFLREMLWNAAAAVMGMARDPYAAPEDIRPEVLASMFGVTTGCVDRASGLLDGLGFDVIVFHATGTGGRSLERAIEERRPAGVIDATTTEWADEIVGGILGAGRERLTAAGRLGIPQVVAPGALDMCNFGPLDSLPERFSGRLLHRHNPATTLMRTNAEECRAIAVAIAERLNQAIGPVTVCLPRGGISELDKPGMAFFDPEADAALFDELTARLEPRIRVVDSPLHINDPPFASLLVDELGSLLKFPVSPQEAR